MSRAHDTALAYLTAQHVIESAQAFHETEPKVVAVTMNPTSKRTKHAKAEAAPIHPKSSVTGITMPERGSLNARDFLLAMRNAGKRLTAEGKPFIDQREIRNDQIKAIHAFYYEVRQGVHVCTGYDPNRDFGSQDTAARMLAQRELRGAPKPSAETAPSRTFSGYVAGMPDYKARALANLQGQEVREADAKIAHLHDAADMSRSVAERELSAALVEVQNEKLAHIRAEMARLVG
jgi:hypothetical protein